MLSKAYRFAEYKHRGQTDKAGKPYIFHVARVADKCDTSSEKIVALLHDVLEDTVTTYDELYALFGSEVTKRVLLLTRDRFKPDGLYYEEIRNDKITLKVKLADIEDNMSEDRMKVLDDEIRGRLMKKYTYAKECLLGM